MRTIDEETGDMEIRQGDTFSLIVSNVDNNCKVYFSVTDAMNNRIFEIEKSPTNNEVLFNITSELSNKLVVPRGRQYERYNYGIKLCWQVNNEWLEDTLVIGNKTIGISNKITVYPLISEGK